MSRSPLSIHVGAKKGNEVVAKLPISSPLKGNEAFPHHARAHSETNGDSQALPPLGAQKLTIHLNVRCNSHVMLPKFAVKQICT